MLFKLFTAVCTEGKSMTGTSTTEKATSFYDENKMTNKCAFSEGWTQNFKKLAA
jgi:hypothetical protein